MFGLVTNFLGVQPICMFYFILDQTENITCHGYQEKFI